MLNLLRIFKCDFDTDAALRVAEAVAASSLMWAAVDADKEDDDDGGGGGRGAFVEAVPFLIHVDEDADGAASVFGCGNIA